MPQKYNCIGIELRHITVDIEADNEQDAANKAMELFKSGDDSVTILWGEESYDEDVEVRLYQDGDLSEGEIFTAINP